MLPIFFISVLVFIILGAPIAVSLGLATAIGAEMHPTLSLQLVPQLIFNSLNSFPLMAIPFFIFAGNLMGVGGIAKRLVNFASALIGHLTGGLAMVAIVTSMFFAALSGSGAATTAAIGSILIPAMVAKGYKIEYAAANQAVAGALGIIIPPSIAMIVYGVTAEVSIADLFMGGVLPGILITFSLVLSAFFFAKRDNIPREERKNLKDLAVAFKESILALLMPIIVLGGIYGGIFTPTEASVVAVFYSLFVGIVIYREMSFKDVWKSLKKSAESTAIIMLVIGAAGLFGFFLSITGVPDLVTGLLQEFVDNKYLFLLVINIILFLMGMFMDGSAAILILVPLLLDTAIGFGIDPLHFGIIMVCNLAIGLVTPPVGIDLFVVSQLTKVPLLRVARFAIPLIIILVVDVLLITYLPFLSTWLPYLLKG
ncbi:TRAP transporter large permease [Oceanobacillus caeni]|uniref:TRAP transporter large permease n=1 Tax=Oceanobacillus caeni TaxID=405946 RepID=UPI001956236A